MGIDTATWMEDARCKGRLDLFFGAVDETPAARVRREAQARLLCQRCPVADTCREHGRAHREHGLWGGETELERVAAGYVVPGVIRRRRRPPGPLPASPPPSPSHARRAG